MSKERENLSPRENLVSIKTYYDPIEAAIRWSGLQAQEEEITKHCKRQTPRMHCSGCPDPEYRYSEWSEFSLKLDQIFDGIVNGDLEYGKNGIKNKDISIDDPELSIRHIAK